jgi:hypothetical protein
MRVYVMFPNVFRRKKYKIERHVEMRPISVKRERTAAKVGTQ